MRSTSRLLLFVVMSIWFGRAASEDDSSIKCTCSPCGNPCSNPSPPPPVPELPPPPPPSPPPPVVLPPPPPPPVSPSQPYCPPPPSVYTPPAQPINPSPPSPTSPNWWTPPGILYPIDPAYRPSVAHTARAGSWVVFVGCGLLISLWS
ncbi:leucine-rich repeat extensin-like protein 3 [Iris pallida]|uniref:Leucine-rich repeat extensin-like protein 3 n=1 Tax=Iris pallida TaxID=29817 RepID=A0AAX6DM32_IRIPA|nr:leucine-rich repeat extensin-like protein 3 [Iris pallida]